MKVVFSTLPASGHFHPLVPLARALKSAGHQVAFASAATFRESVERLGFEFLAAGSTPFGPPGMDPSQVQARQREMMRTVLDPQAMAAHVSRLFLGEHVQQRAKEVVGVLEGWKPDLLVRDGTDFAACAAAERLGIPHASVQVGGGDLTRSPMAAMIGERLDALRSAVGLPTGDGLAMPKRYLNLAFAPRRFFDDLGPTTQYLQLAVFDQSGAETIPEWMNGVNGPLAYASLGTVFNKDRELLQTLIESFRELPLEVLVTVGRDVDPATLRTSPPKVHVERYVPQSLVLPRCSVAVLHGGYNSTLSGIAAGVPMVMVPVAADQPMNARRCAAMGLGRVVPAVELSAPELRDAVNGVLADPSFRKNVQELRDEAAAQPPMEHAVALLEKLARDKQPLLANR